jgi:lysophospholipase L1-like esterase
MNAVIRAEADRRGFAYFALAALYEQANRKAPFSAVTLLTSPQPYGPLISLDGLHPSAAGSAVLAEAAASALNARYEMGIPTSTHAASGLAAR